MFWLKCFFPSSPGLWPCTWTTILAPPQCNGLPCPSPLYGQHLGKTAAFNLFVKKAFPRSCIVNAQHVFAKWISKDMILNHSLQYRIKPIMIRWSSVDSTLSQSTQGSHWLARSKDLHVFVCMSITMRCSFGPVGIFEGWRWAKDRARSRFVRVT